MSAVELFSYADTAVRVVTVDGEPWFVLELHKRLGGVKAAS